MITQEELKTLVTYNQLNGQFVRKKKINRELAGTILSRTTDTGYLIISIKQTTYRLHRLAFMYMTGKWPLLFVDHINGDKSDNTWNNLREYTRTQNSYNVGIKSTNTSGYKGVSFRTDRNKWRAYIRVDGLIKHLCYFDDIDLADLVVTEARERYHGEYAKHE